MAERALASQPAAGLPASRPGFVTMNEWILPFAAATGELPTLARCHTLRVRTSRSRAAATSLPSAPARVQRPLANFFASGVLALAAKLGPFPLAVSPHFRFDAARMAAFLAGLPRDSAAALALAKRHDERMRGRSYLTIDPTRPLRHAIDIRHRSFECKEFVELFREQGVALVVADTAGSWPYLEDVTTDFLYLRLHGDRELYVSGYTDRALERWAVRIRVGRWWRTLRRPTVVDLASKAVEKRDVLLLRQH